MPIRIVPFNPRYALESDRPHFLRIVGDMAAAGLPVWPVENAYGETPYASLIVNQMDHHPNETSNALLADAVEPLLVELLRDGRVDDGATSRGAEARGE